MSCSTLTSARLESLLAGSLPKPELELLRAHLLAPCDDCLTRLSEVDGERILWAMAGPAAELSDREQERLFSAAVTSSQPISAPSLKLATEPQPLRATSAALEFKGLASFFRAFFSQRPQLRPAFALAVLLLVSAPVLIFYASDADGPYQGVKGVKDVTGQVTAPPTLELIGFVGEVTSGAPRLVRPAVDGERLGPGQQLLLRYRLQTQAYLYLLMQGPEGPPEVLEAPGPEPTPPGDYEWLRNEQVMGLDFTSDGQVKVVAVAAPRPVPVEQLKSLEVAALRALCDDCQMASLTIVGQGPR